MGRQLASYDNTTYTYNEGGIRTSKTVGEDTTEFYLNGTNVVYQTDGTNDIYFFYDRNYEIVGFKYNGNNYFYVKNAMGDITDITDSSGAVVASYSYDPWGKVTSVSGSNLAIANLNPFRYRSYYYDDDIGMYYLQSRYYNPEVGRFINCDDVNYIGYSDTARSYNAFTYCENNPINMKDPRGYSNINISISYIYTNFYFWSKGKDKTHFFLEIYTNRKFSDAELGIDYFFMFISVNSKNIVSVDLTLYDSAKKAKKQKQIIEKNVRYNKWYMQNLVRYNLTRTIAEYVIEAHKRVYKKGISFRNLIGIEFEILLHIYAYYFDFDKYKYYARTESIEVDNGLSAILMQTMSSEYYIKICKQAICSGKQNAILSSILRRAL